MHVHPLEWAVTLTVTIAVLLSDVAVMARRAGQEPTMRRSAVGLSIYIALAGVFGVWLWIFHGHQFAIQFFAGWLTEYSLSVDNLFIFVILMAGFGVPRIYQREALFIGIVIALVFRGIFIALGAAAIQRFTWVFYVFGAFLVYTAVRLARGATHNSGGENALVRFARNHLRVTDEWHGRKLVVTGSDANGVAGRSITPMALVVLALGATDLVFALDSIPAIYGLTSEPYLVMAANVFALMGLRQLYFIVEGLLQRLVYLSKGLAVILVFIGAKLILHAMHENDLPFINGGKHFDVPEIPTLVSLGVIAATLVVAAVASIVATRGDDQA
ncbi:TerC/Alx family metal homeostasis membrane protein [Candidatus Mycobacterium wuenschmannii]|uniref:TerC/Alx family metal homeostasis membrane protein n=1 Tax=Candidatus Mycobacterium wuenschmannii TaxID=3027808 RepID=A0ABY8VUB3_9MYCO|nr:TerC/Alx family metal homeostasis membrane protein [Candidatus Mycobacterium wuenschmannii]WIM86384.1 TerC/Alx family metal homeostasis membrane protein [Candidatus Mycobacterium wuenschmannii]